MKGILCIAFVFLVCAEAGAGTAVPGRDADVSLQYSLERDYGYFIGDLVTIAYRIRLPMDRYLDRSSLSKERRDPEGGFAVRGSTIRESSEDKNRVYHVSIVYQIFSASKSPRMLRTPALPFHYGPKGNPAANASALPAVAITVSPLTSAGAQFKPLMVWARPSSSSKIFFSIGIAILLLSIFVLSFAMRRRFRGSSPFSAALRGLKAESDPAVALAQFRTALNAKAGRAVFSSNVEDFLRAFPAAQCVREEIRYLVALSDELSFNPRNSVQGGEVIERVSKLVKRLRRMERWR